MELFDYLTNELEMHPFLVEILDFTGYNTVTKLKTLNEDAVERLILEMNGNLENSSYFKNYDVRQYMMYQEQKQKGEPFDLQLTLGDLSLLSNLINLIDETRIKKQIKKYKRKLPEEFKSETSNSPNKSTPIDQDRLNQWTSIFHSYVDKIKPGSETFVDATNGTHPKFSLTCNLCCKKICLGYKRCLSGGITFCKTNFVRHPCIKSDPCIKSEPDFEEFE